MLDLCIYMSGPMIFESTGWSNPFWLAHSEMPVLVWEAVWSFDMRLDSIAACRLCDRVRRRAARAGRVALPDGGAWHPDNGAAGAVSLRQLLLPCHRCQQDWQEPAQ